MGRVVCGLWLAGSGAEGSVAGTAPELLRNQALLPRPQPRPRLLLLRRPSRALPSSPSFPPRVRLPVRRVDTMEGEVVCVQMRYSFEHPEGTGHGSSPFFSIWYCYLGQHATRIFQWYQATQGALLDLHPVPPVLMPAKRTRALTRLRGGAGDKGSLRLVRRVEELAGGVGGGESRGVEGVSLAKRLNPRQRKALRNKKKQNIAMAT
eukprot:1327351-Rhodomonas_salina.3